MVLDRVDVRRDWVSVVNWDGSIIMFAVWVLGVGVGFWNGRVGRCCRPTLLLHSAFLFVNCFAGANAFIGLMIGIDSSTVVAMQIGVGLIVPPAGKDSS